MAGRMVNQHLLSTRKKIMLGLKILFGREAEKIKR